MRKSINHPTKPWRAIIWVALLALTFAVTACGDNDSGTDEDAGMDMTDVTACSEDTEGPTVEAFPSSPLMIPTGQTEAELQLTFSEPVDGVDANSVIVEGANVSSVSGSSDDTVFTVSISGLEDGNDYQVVLADGSVMDKCGNPLDGELDYGIMVVDPCELDSTAPVVRSNPPSPIELPAGTTEAQLELTFSESVLGIDSSSLTIDNGASVDEVTDDGNVYTVQISGLSSGATVLTIPGSVEDSCGNALAETTVELTVDPADEVAPSVSMTMPADGASDVNPSATFAATWSEPINRATGTATIEASGESIDFVSQWDVTDTVLTLTSLQPYPYDANVTVTLSGYEDVAGNVQEADSVTTFTAGADPCAGLKPQVAVENPDAASQVTGGEADVYIWLEDNYPLTETDISLAALGSGTGTVLPMSLVQMDPLTWRFTLTGVNTGEAYEVTVDGASTDGCTQVGPGSFVVTLRDLVTTTQGACPLPAALPQHYASADACGDASSNDSLGAAESTGFTLARGGEAFSISGIIETDGTNNDDWYSFELAEDGILASELQITGLYGCDVTGSSSSTTEPDIDVYDSSGNQLLNFEGELEFGDIDGVNFGRVGGTVYLAGPPGTNTYYLKVDDPTSGICTNYHIYTELVSQRIVGCAGQPSTATPSTVQQEVFLQSGNTSAPAFVFLDAPFELTSGALTLNATNGGSGTIQASSFTKITDQLYSLTLDGIAVGDTYDLSVARDSTTCTNLVPADVPLLITDQITLNGICPLPPTLQDHFAAPDACDASTTNGNSTDAADTGFTLTNSGDAFSIGGTYDSGGSPGDEDWFEFQIDEDGMSTYDIRVDFVYGCAFSNGGTPGAYAPIIELHDDTGSVIGDSFAGDQEYAAINDALNYGIATSQFAVGNPAAGLRTYQISIDDDVGSTWCMDYQFYVTLEDTSRPVACVGSTPTAQLQTTAVTLSPSGGGTSVVPITFDSPYAGLQQSDLTLTQTSGTGSGALVPNSLAGGPTDYTVELTGEANQDSYLLSIAGGTNACSTTFAAADLSIEYLDVSCPYPAPLSNNFTAPDLCGQQTTNTKSSAADVGFTLSSAGDAFSIDGIYDSDGSDFDWFVFDVNADGTSDYTIRIQMLYGCGFTGSGTPSSTTEPNIIFELDGSTTDIADFDGNDTYGDVDGSGNFGVLDGTFTIPAADLPAGPNDVYFRIDDVLGSSWCMDYYIIVSLEAVN